MTVLCLVYGSVFQSNSDLIVTEILCHGKFNEPKSYFPINVQVFQYGWVYLVGCPWDDAMIGAKQRNRIDCDIGVSISVIGGLQNDFIDLMLPLQ